MNTVDVLERAIKRLEELRDGHSMYGSHPWRDEAHDDRGYTTRVISADGYPVPGCFNCGDNEGIYEGTDAALIAALSRAVDPILDFLRFARALFGAQIQGEQAAATVDLALYLARAVLGEVE